MNLKSKKIIILILITTLACGVLYFFSKNKFHRKGIVLGTGDFTNQIIGTTNTQAVLTYSSPTTSPCTVLVSESASYSPLINDVNPTLFTGSDKDDRLGSSSSGTERIFVIGKRSADLALDGNRYSRALQAYTTHYYKIICGSFEGTGSFTTKTIPTGLTYSDTIPHNGSGSSSWPTLLNDRSQVIIDPQTGLKITRGSLATDIHDTYFGGAVDFASNGAIDSCNPTKVSDGSGNMGYHCVFSDRIFWIDPSSGEVRIVGDITKLYDGVDWLSFQSCGSYISQIDPDKFYCILTWQQTNEPILVEAQYLGDNTYLNGFLPECNGSNQPCLNWKILTPDTTGHSIKSMLEAFDPEYIGFNPTFGYHIKSLQNNYIMVETYKSIQDSYGWGIAFDIGNGIPAGEPGSTFRVAGLSSTYKHYPIRWCSVHGLGTPGNVNWLSIGTNNLKGGSGESGYGIYETLLAGGATMSNSTTSCPTNPWNRTVCSNITVAGEPCDQNETAQNANAKCPNPATDSYLQDAEPGDIFGIDPTLRGRYYSEFVQLIEKSGNNWTVARGLNQTPVVSHTTGVLDAICTSHDTEQSNYDLGGYILDFENDPHGTGTPGTTIFFDKNSTGGHGAYKPNTLVQIDSTITYKVRKGAPPSYIDATPIYLDDTDPPFAGIHGIGLPNTVESHVSQFYNDTYAFDARPMNSGITYNAPAINLGGGIYKYPVGAVDLHRKILPTIAYSNVYILNDISSPNSDINTASDHSYCVVENAGECNAGSLPTEVYVKSTTATTSLCPFPGVAVSGWEQQHICLGDNAVFNQAISQIGPTVRTQGKNSRMLTHGLTTYNRQEVFWNTRSFPDTSTLLFNLPQDPIYGYGAGQLFVAKLPPFVVDSVVRDDFLSIPVTVPAPTDSNVTSASIKFGYAENGNPENFYCTSRNEACVKASESGKNYSFNSENFSPVSCASGCTINIPAIPSRIVYLKVQYHDSNGDVISTLNTQIVAAEPEFNISSASGPSFSVSSISTSNIQNTSATITWTTSTSTNSQVLYGLTDSYASSTSISDTSPRVTSHTVNLTGLTKNKTYLFVVKSVDALGNSITSSEQTFTTSNRSEGLEEDTTPPTVSVTSPISSATVSGSGVIITASVSDDVGVSGVQFNLNTTINIGSEDTTSPYSITWDSTTVNNGSYNILAIARDTSGNITTSTAVTITVNNSSNSGSGTTTVISSNGGGGGYSGSVYTPIQIPNYENQDKQNLKTEDFYSTEKNECIINNNGTYNLIFEGQRYGFSSPAMLAAHGYDFKDAIQPEPQDKTLPYSSKLLPPDGAIIKSAKNPTIYIVSSGKKRPFANLKIFTTWGYKQSSILNFSESEINSIPTGELVTNSETRHLRGTNIKDGNTIYWLGEKVRYPYKNPDSKTTWQSIFETWNTEKDFNNILTANEYDKKIPIAEAVVPRKTCK